MRFWKCVCVLVLAACSGSCGTLEQIGGQVVLAAFTELRETVGEVVSGDPKPPEAEDSDAEMDEAGEPRSGADIPEEAIRREEPDVANARGPAGALGVSISTPEQQKKETR